jgi:hypothetical protein
MSCFVIEFYFMADIELILLFLGDGDKARLAVLR